MNMFSSTWTQNTDVQFNQYASSFPYSPYSLLLHPEGEKLERVWSSLFLLYKEGIPDGFYLLQYQPPIYLSITIWAFYLSVYLSIIILAFYLSIHLSIDRETDRYNILCRFTIYICYVFLYIYWTLFFCLKSVNISFIYLCSTFKKTFSAFNTRTHCDWCVKSPRPRTYPDSFLRMVYHSDKICSAVVFQWALDIEGWNKEVLTNSKRVTDGLPWLTALL